MKKNLFMVAAVALLALVSCNKEEINNGGVEPQEPQTPSVTVEFTASLEEGTKTTLDAANRKTLWVNSDRISINGQEFRVDKIQEDGKAIFVNVNELPGGFAAPFTAIYPYGSNGVPATQTAYANNFDPAAVIETATSEDYSLHFSNESSLLKFQVPVNCNSVTLSADEELAKGSNTVTISGEMEVGKDYYVAVLPGTKANFAVKIEDYVVKSAVSVNIKKSSIINMALPYNVYLHAKTSKYDWTSDEARFATWTWGTDVQDSWFDMIPEGHDGVYRLEVPTGYANIIFCRLDGSKSENDWANVWNQTADQVIPTNNSNHFYISDSAAGAWGDKDYTFPVVKPESGYLYLRPSSEWLQANAQFVAWAWKDSGSGKVYKFEPHSTVPGLYQLDLSGNNKIIIIRMSPETNVTEGSTSWPGDGWNKSGNLSITGNMCTVTGWSSFAFSTVEEL